LVAASVIAASVIAVSVIAASDFAASDIGLVCHLRLGVASRRRGLG
jgi:hypothetical protein